MIIKTYKFFNQATKQALLDQVGGYISKSKSVENEIQKIKSEYNLAKIYRFDLGENVDGYSPNIFSYLEELYQNNELFSKLNEYPDITHVELRKQLASLYNIDKEQLVISTGLDSILDLITRVFFEYNDVYLMPIPDFFLFEEYSERMGAMPIFLPLDEENNFRWTIDTVSEYKALIARFKPKLVWLSNPSNPSGQVIEDDIMIKIIDIASNNNTFVVVDEAYGEYIGTPVKSFARFINKYHNLMVLRTFSKAYGLAGIRLGYLMCGSEDIIKAMLLHRHHFPATQLSIILARYAIKDQNFIEKTRNVTEKRKHNLFNKLNTLTSFRFIPSETNIFMIKNNNLSDYELEHQFKKQGIIVSLLRISGVNNKNYMRVTIRTDEDNDYFYSVCKKIDNIVK